MLIEHIVGNDMMVRLSECTLHSNKNNTSQDKLNINITESNENMHTNNVQCSAFDASCEDLRKIENNANKKVKK